MRWKKALFACYPILIKGLSIEAAIGFTFYKNIHYLDRIGVAGFIGTSNEWIEE